MHLILCILSLHVLFLLGKPAKLFGTTHPDWAPSLHLGNENYNSWSCKSSSTIATERYERSEKRKVLADTQSPSNVQLRKRKLLIKILMAILLIVSFYRVACNTSSYLLFGRGL